MSSKITTITKHRFPNHGILIRIRVTYSGGLKQWLAVAWFASRRQAANHKAGHIQALDGVDSLDIQMLNMKLESNQKEYWTKDIDEEYFV